MKLETLILSLGAIIAITLLTIIIGNSHPIDRFSYAFDDWLQVIDIKECSFEEYRADIENCLKH